MGTCLIRLMLYEAIFLLSLVMAQMFIDWLCNWFGSLIEGSQGVYPSKHIQMVNWKHLIAEAQG